MTVAQLALSLFTRAVNTASRMESHGYPMCVHTSEATYQAAQAVAADMEYVADDALLIPPFADEVRSLVFTVCLRACAHV